MIDTRQELLIALREASELEQGLMIQYLFAGMTLKHESDDSLTADQRDLVSDWRDQIYMVAREEMGHLGTVQNITVALGGSPYFSIPRFPTPAKYFEDKKFTLEPLTLDTIDRFVTFEAPEEPVIRELVLVPDPLEYKTVGSLYNQVAMGIEALGDDVAFIGPATDQDVADWSASVEVHPVTSVATAHAAIQDIIIEGEGTLAGGEHSHYQKFKNIAEAYRAELDNDPDFVPYRNVLSNPTVMSGRPEAALVEATQAREVCALFNSVYTTMLLAFAQYYKFQEQQDVPIQGINPQVFLRTNILAGLMKSVVRPLGQTVLPDLVAVGGEMDQFAAPPFEQFLPPVVPWNRKSTWIIFSERLASEAEFAESRKHAHPAMEVIANSLKLISSTVDQLQG